MDQQPSLETDRFLFVPNVGNPDLDRDLETLQAAKRDWATAPIIEKIFLLEETTRLLGLHADAWVQAAIAAKGIDPDSPWVGEEWVSGPWVVAEGLNAYRRTLDALEQGRLPPLEKMRTTANGRLAVQVFPATRDQALILSGITSEVWMQPGVTAANLADHMASFYKQRNPVGKVALVLGAGNISAIAPLDALYRLVVRGHVAMVKLSPILEYLGPVLEQIFEPFMRRGYVRFAYGGAAVGEYLTRHDDVDEIHFTGGFDSYDKIVYGSDGESGLRRRSGEPVVTKPMTAELGGASPCIVVPGKWSAADLRYQAENVVTMKMHNGGFNCVAIQVLITPRAWPQREAFLQAIRDVMRELPGRHAYYPGVAERWHAVRERHAHFETFAGDVPMTLLPGLDAENDGEDAFTSEYFGPILAETALPGNDARNFLTNAVWFCNERLLGNLGANMIIDPRTRRALGPKLDAFLADLRYGAIGVNVWDAASFLLGEATWGAYPEPARLHRTSGTGVVRNAYLFDRSEKSVSYGPYRPFPRALLHGDKTILPKPPWFVTNKTAAETAEQIVNFTVNPLIRDLPRLFFTALRG